MTFTGAGVLRLDVPPRTRRADIEATVRAHGRWISHRLSRAEDEGVYTAPGLRQGDAHHYLGRLHPLQLQAGDAPAGIRLEAGELQILGADRLDRASLIDLLRDWYRARGVEVFAARLRQLSAGLDWLEEPPPWRQRYMSSQWGSCTASGRLSLNTHLLKASVELIDYVLTHELCHLRHLHHGPQFYALMERSMPDWKRRRADLNRLTPMLRDPF